MSRGVAVATVGCAHGYTSAAHRAARTAGTAGGGSLHDGPGRDRSSCQDDPARVSSGHVVQPAGPCWGCRGQRHAGVRRRRALHRAHRAPAERPGHRVRAGRRRVEVGRLHGGQSRDGRHQRRHAAAEGLPFPHRAGRVHRTTRRRRRPGHDGEQPCPGLRAGRLGGHAGGGQGSPVPVRRDRHRRRRRVGALRDHGQGDEDRCCRRLAGGRARILLGGDRQPARRGERDRSGPHPSRRCGPPGG